MRGGGGLPPLDYQFKTNVLLLKYSAYSLVDTLIVDIIDNVWKIGLASYSAYQ